MTREGKVIRTVRESNPGKYLARAAEGRFEAERRIVAPEDLSFEFALNVLRLAEGVPACRWEETTGEPLSAIEPVLSGLRQKGLLAPSADVIAATDLGRRFLSDVQEAFLQE